MSTDMVDSTIYLAVSDDIDPINMPEFAGTESELKRCRKHRFNSDLVSAHSGMFTGEWQLTCNLGRATAPDTGITNREGTFCSPRSSNINTVCRLSGTLRIWPGGQWKHDQELQSGASIIKQWRCSLLLKAVLPFWIKTTPRSNKTYPIA